jgi:integrase
MRKQGISPDMARKAAGHKTAQTSERYTHYNLEDVKKAFEALGRGR